jgi:hypothetical protein
MRTPLFLLQRDSATRWTFFLRSLKTKTVLFERAVMVFTIFAVFLWWKYKSGFPETVSDSKVVPKDACDSEIVSKAGHESTREGRIRNLYLEL